MIKRYKSNNEVVIRLLKTELIPRLHDLLSTMVQQMVLLTNHDNNNITLEDKTKEET